MTLLRRLWASLIPRRRGRGFPNVKTLTKAELIAAFANVKRRCDCQCECAASWADEIPKLTEDDK